MSKSEIVMRLLSAEAKIKLADMRSGRMSDDDWTRLARRMSEISEAPLYIDDSPNLTMMEIRAKARRLSQKAGLKLIVVDYMQLMTSGKKYESRQQEVSDFSRSLKLMAKELDVPVVAISQLNRGPEQRTDKRPMISDLRESGCLTANTRILRADNGAEVTFGELMRTGERPLVWSLDERKRMVARPMTNVFYSGHKEVFKMRLASGREVEATANHPFMTFDGWTPLGELKVGDRLAVPRRVPEPVQTERMDDSEIILLAHMIGDGSCVKRQPIRYASIDEQNLAAVAKAAQHFGVTAVRDDYAAARVTTLRLPAPYRLTHGKRNPIAAWLDKLGLVRQAELREVRAARGFRATERSDRVVPAAPVGDGRIRALGRQGTAGAHLLRVDESAACRRRACSCCSGWEYLQPDQARTQGRLPRLRGICTSIGAENQTRFLALCQMSTARSCSRHARFSPSWRAMSATPISDTVPRDVWTQSPNGAGGQADYASPVRAGDGHQVLRLNDVEACAEPSAPASGAALLDDVEIHDLTTNDVFWDEIVEITSIGEHDVYDGTVSGTHNFVANLVSLT